MYGQEGLRNYLKTQFVILSAAKNLLFLVSQTLRFAQGDSFEIVSKGKTERDRIFVRSACMGYHKDHGDLIVLASILLAMSSFRNRSLSGSHRSLRPNRRQILPA